jgi:hypothetical protein
MFSDNVFISENLCEIYSRNWGTIRWVKEKLTYNKRKFFSFKYSFEIRRKLSEHNVWENGENSVLNLYLKYNFRIKRKNFLNLIYEKKLKNFALNYNLNYNFFDKLLKRQNRLLIVNKHELTLGLIFKLLIILKVSKRKRFFNPKIFHFEKKNSKTWINCEKNYYNFSHKLRITSMFVKCTKRQSKIYDNDE